MPRLNPGAGGVGWSLAHKAALWARLGDGNEAWLFVRTALRPVTDMELRYNGGGGVYPNLFGRIIRTSRRLHLQPGRTDDLTPPVRIVVAGGQTGRENYE